jgi:hypothetical protein
VASVLVGATRPGQLEESVAGLALLDRVGPDRLRSLLGDDGA